MQDHKDTNQILHYFKFGVNAFFDSFNQTTLVVVSITLPITIVAFSIQPDLKSIFRDIPDFSLFLALKWLFSQVILRAASVFIFILVILRLELQRKGEEIFWDFSLSFNCLKKVILVDFVFSFGLQIFLALVLFFINVLLVSFLGNNVFTVLLAFSLCIFAAVVLFIRFYFCTFYVLLKQTNLKNSFQQATLLSKNSEIKIFKLVVIYHIFTIFLSFLLFSIIGSSFFSKIIVHNLISVLFVPYCYAGYSLFFDLLEEKFEVTKD
tara:strand:- start:17135 stop:17929 length:795 start_codon:yes stop_codon:yes gene_type:complete